MYNLKAHPHRIKMATDWLQTGFRLASDSKIGVNGAMNTNGTQSCFKQLGSQLGVPLVPILFWCGWTFNERSYGCATKCFSNCDLYGHPSSIFARVFIIALQHYFISKTFQILRYFCSRTLMFIVIFVIAPNHSNNRNRSPMHPVSKP